MKEKSAGVPSDFDGLRERTLNDLIWLFALLITPGVAMSVSRAWLLGWLPLFNLQLALLLLVWGLVGLRKRLSYGWRVSALLFLWWGFIIASQVYLGPLADSKVGMILVVQVAALLLPLRMGWWMLAAVGTVLGLLGLATVGDWLTYSIDYQDYTRNPLAWGLTVYLYLAFSAMSLFVAKRMISALRQALAAAQDNAGQLREAQTVACVGSWSYRAADQHLTWSDETYRLFGVELGKPVRFEDFSAWVDPGDRPAFKGAWRQAGETGIFDVEHRIKRADGEVRWLHQRARLYFDGEHRWLEAVGTTQDVTWRKRAEQILRESERRFRDLFEHSPVAYQALDEQGQIVDVNDRFCQLLGYAPENLLGHNFSEFWCPENRPAFPYLFDYLKHSRSLGVELRLVRRDGSALAILIEGRVQQDAEGRFIKAHCIMADITERKRVEDALFESGKRLKLALAASNMGVWEWNLRTQAVFWSPECYDIFGVDSFGGTFDDFLKLLHPEDAKRIDAAAKAALEGRDVFPSEFRATRPSGDVIWLSSRGGFRYDETGRPSQIVGTVRDITGRRAAEEALIQAKLEAERASRAKSEFLSRMSHELRTPLNAIIGFSQLLELGVPGPLEAQQKELVGHIRNGGHHLLSLINEVLDLARIEAGRLDLRISDVRLDSVVDDALSAVSPLANERDIHIIRPGLFACQCPVRTDPVRLRQVLLNLLSNAVKYSPEGSAVEVSCASSPLGVRVAVTDRGIGIPENKQALLFQPFERLGIERTGIDGTGIGLAIARKLVEAMGGNLGFESEYGVGSTFWVDVPVSEACEMPCGKDGTEPLPASSEVANSGGLVLYIEDNPANVVLMRHIFRQLPGLELIIADDAETGLLLAYRHQPDLILMDIHLPGLSGLDALRRLRANPATRPIPVFAVSALAMPHDISAGTEAGFAAYITKPFDVPALIRQIREVLAKPVVVS